MRGNARRAKVVTARTKFTRQRVQWNPFHLLPHDTRNTSPSIRHAFMGIGIGLQLVHFYTCPWLSFHELDALNQETSMSPE